MQTSRTPRKGPKFLDTKVLIATLSMVVTVGLWNLFSNNAIQVQKSQAVETSPPPQPSAADAQDFPPLPTLVPLVSISPLTSNDAVAADNAGLAPQPSLRAVTAPTQVIVQKNKVRIEQAGSANSVSNNGGNGGGGGSAPVTTTKSSQPR
jgi:hypothetical protein